MPQGEMTACERVRAALNHEEPDQVAFTDFPWFTTVERWLREGLPPELGPWGYFDWAFTGFAANNSLMLPTQVIEETDDYVIARNADGVTTKNWKHSVSTPALLAFSLTGPRAWEELKPRLAFGPERLNWEQDRPKMESARQAGKFVHFAAAIGYDQLSSIVGPDTLLPAMLTDPEWVEDMFKTYMDLTIAGLEEMLAIGYQFDGAFVFDDLGYRNGTFFSTEMYRELLFPQHKRLCDVLHSKGWKVILHSCGNVNRHIPALIEAGFDCLQPLEVKAGMDLVQLKKDYGDVLAFMGGIDVRAMAHPDPAVIEEEIRSKIPIAKAGGGYIYHSDHSIPDNVSFEQYKRVRDLVYKYGKRS